MHYHKIDKSNDAVIGNMPLWTSNLTSPTIYKIQGYKREQVSFVNVFNLDTLSFYIHIFVLLNSSLLPA